MKILFGSDLYYPSVNGISYFSQRLAAGLERNGDVVHVICPSENTRSTVERRERLIIHKVGSLRTPFYSGLRFSPLVYNYVLKTVTRIRPQVIHIHDHLFIGRALVKIGARLNIPIVATNNLLPENLTAQLSFLPKAIRTWANDCIWKDLAKVYNQVPIIATPSLVGVTLLHANGIHQRVKVVTSGVDLVRFTNSQENCAVREKYKIPDLPTYMYVGRLDAEKHIGELIKALPLVLEKVDAQLVIAGTGELEGDLTRFARKQKVTARVIFTGFVDYEDLPRVYSACDVFCIAGSAELQSMVALEAMAMSKPIMAARATALPALIREGVNGYTFELGNSQDLADRLIELLTDPSKCEAMGKRSFEMVAAHSVERTIAAYGELYKTAIQGNALRK